MYNVGDRVSVLHKGIVVEGEIVGVTGPHDIEICIAMWDEGDQWNYTDYISVQEESIQARLAQR